MNLEWRVAAGFRMREKHIADYENDQRAHGDVPGQHRGLLTCGSFSVREAEEPRKDEHQQGREDYRDTPGGAERICQRNEFPEPVVKRCVGTNAAKKDDHREYPHRDYDRAAAQLEKWCYNRRRERG